MQVGQDFDPGDKSVRDRISISLNLVCLFTVYLHIIFPSFLTSGSTRPDVLLAERRTYHSVARPIPPQLQLGHSRMNSCTDGCHLTFRIERILCGKWQQLFPWHISPCNTLQSRSVSASCIRISKMKKSLRCLVSGLPNSNRQPTSAFSFLVPTSLLPNSGIPYPSASSPEPERFPNAQACMNTTELSDREAHSLPGSSLQNQHLPHHKSSPPPHPYKQRWASSPSR